MGKIIHYRTNYRHKNSPGFKTLNSKLFKLLLAFKEFRDAHQFIILNEAFEIRGLNFPKLATTPIKPGKAAC